MLGVSRRFNILAAEGYTTGLVKLLLGDSAMGTVCHLWKHITTYKPTCLYTNMLFFMYGKTVVFG
jgi:hypothetical protein